MNSLPSTASHELTVSRQSRIELFEKGYSILAWLFFSNGVGTVLGESSILVKLIRYSILLIAVFFMAARPQRTLRTLSKGLLLWPIIGLMIGSLAWSFSPTYTEESIRGEVIPMTAFAIYYASRFSIRDQMRLFGIALAIGAALSLFYALAIPSVGRHVGDKFDGAWKGIYSQKNAFSSTMTLTMMLYFVLSLINEKPRERRVAQIGLAFAIAMILLSTSVSGMIIFITGSIVVLAARLFHWKGKRSVLVIDLVGFVLLGGGALLSMTWQSIVIGLGKDPTLSARTYIWEGSIDKIMDRPWLGYGRSAFWVPDSKPAWEIGALAVKGFVPAHAHNGFIDVGLELGLVGLGIFLVGLLLTYGLAIRRAYQATRPEDLWPFSFLTLLVMSNMTESVLTYRASLYWVMYMVIFLSLRLRPPRRKSEELSTA